MTRTHRIIFTILLFLYSIIIEVFAVEQTFYMNKAYELVTLARDKRASISTAESCTGGMVSAAITAIPGSSEIFEYGYVTYANEAKVKLLKVSQNTIIKYGAVSEQTAKEMAVGALKNSNSDIAIGITGIAGPTGGSVNKPVGTVFIAVATPHKKTFVQRYVFQGDRAEVRTQATQKALEMLIETIKLS